MTYSPLYYLLLLPLCRWFFSSISSETQDDQTNCLKVSTLKTKYLLMKSANRPPASIRTRSQYQAWKQSRQRALEHRIWQAERAEYDWPSTRRRSDLMHLQRELDELLDSSFPTPETIYNTAQAVWPPRAAGVA